MNRAPVTRMVEDYVTLIWKGREWPGGQPTTTDLAAQLGVTPSTVSRTSSGSPGTDSSRTSPTAP